MQLVDRFEKTEVPVYTTVEKIVEVPQILEKIVERIVILPQVVEVLKYVHEISESEDPGVALSGDIVESERVYKELYGVTKGQLNLILSELRRLRQTQPALAQQIDLLERYLTDFDRLAAAQRIVPVDKEVIVEKDVTKAVIVPTKDSETIRNELALSLLVEKLINELKRVKKDNPNVQLALDNDVGLIFFPELYNTLNITVGDNADFTKRLKDYTAATTAKLQSLGGGWTSDNELILYTILQDRFTMANIITQANIEIERSRAISDARGNSLKEIENQLFQASKILAYAQKALKDLLANNPSLAENEELRKLADSLDGYVTSGWSVQFDEPVMLLGDLVGSGDDWNRLSSFAREREAEIELLKRRIYDIQKASIKAEYSGVDTERTLATLRNENGELVKEIDRLRSTASMANNSAAREKELELKLRTANARIQELESQLRTAELKLKELKESKSSAAASSVGPNTNLTSSQYSTSSVDQYAGRKTYDTPSYGVNSSYSEASNVSSEVKTAAFVQSTTSNVYSGSYGNY